MSHANTTLAERFRQDNEEHFFEAAHDLVELMASRVATELSYNTFQFPDGSVLQIRRRFSMVETMSPSQFAQL